MAVSFIVFASGCAPVSVKLNGAAISPRSPFYEQRVIIKAQDLSAPHFRNGELQSESEVKATESGQVQVAAGTEMVLLISNSCAATWCGGEKENGIACGLYKEHVSETLLSEVQAYEWTVPKDSSIEEIEQAIAADPTDDRCVVGVSVNKIYRSESMPLAQFNDPGAISQYYHSLIRGDQVYNFFKTEKIDPVIVGIIDTGHQRHEDVPHGAGWTWKLPTTTSCTDICNAHGTFIAGIIGGTQNNSKGGFGIAHNAIMYSMQVGNSSGAIKTSELVNGMQELLRYKPEIINMSLGGPDARDFSFEHAMITAMDSDVLIVVAAGNDGRDIAAKPTYPASFGFPGQITVGSASPKGVDENKSVPFEAGADATIVRDSFSNYGSGLVQIAAPGRGIYSSMLNNTYGIWNGTSFSAPMVTAAAALALGYLKAKKAPYSSLSLKQLVLEGSHIENSMTEILDGREQRPFQGNRFLNLARLKDAIVRYAAQSGESAVAKIGIVSSETVGSGAAKKVKMRVEVANADVSRGLVLTLHTSKSFLDESQLAVCQVLQERTFCDLEIAFGQMYADPGPYYLAVRDADRQLVSELSFPKEALNFGVRAEAPLLGEIHLVKHLTNRFQIEGWSCLQGFPDKVNIEVRFNSPEGAPIATFPTSVAARGRYFDACQAAEITFGFSYTPHAVYTRLGGKLFFRAVHPGTGKKRDLPVLSYLPSYQDPNPEKFTDSVYLDPNVFEEEPEIKITRREFSDWKLYLEGTACFKNSKKPASFATGLFGRDFLQLYKRAASASGFARGNIADYRVAASVTSKGIYKSFINDLDYATPENAGELLTWNQSFSEIHVGRPLFLTGIGPRLKYRHSIEVPYEDPTVAKIRKNFITIFDDVFQDEYNLRTIHPNIDTGDGCPFPSGFKVIIPFRERIDSIGYSFSMLYNSEVFPTEQSFVDYLDQSKEWEFMRAGVGQDGSISELNFDPGVFGVRIKTLFGRQTADLNTDLFGFREDLGLAVGATAGWKSVKVEARCSEHSGAVAYCDSISPLNYRSEPDHLTGLKWNSIPDSQVNSVQKDFGYSYHLTGNPRGARSRFSGLWVDGTKVSLNSSSNEILNVVYESPLIELPKIETGELFAGFQIAWVDSKISKNQIFGELGVDLKVQIWIDGYWYELPVDAETPRDVIAVTSVSKSAKNAKIRILANGKNQFEISGIGLKVE